MNKYEQLIEFIINEEEDKARELFHSIVVEKSRDIYESLIDEQDLEEVGGNQVDSLVDEITADETGGMVEADDEFGGEEPVEFGGEESEFDFDDNGELDAHEQEHEGEESRIDDLEDALEELKAEFEALMAGESGSGKSGSGEAEEFGGEEEGEEAPEQFGEGKNPFAKSGSGSASGSGAKSGSGSASGSGSGRKMTEAESIREYVEKVGNIYGGKGDANEGNTVGTGGDEPTVNKQSTVAGKNDMGGTASNVATGGAEQAPDGTSPKKASNYGTKGQGEIKSGNVNVPGGKAALQKGPTADRTKEGKFATGGGVPVNSKSEIGGKVR